MRWGQFSCKSHPLLDSLTRRIELMLQQLERYPADRNQLFYMLDELNLMQQELVGILSYYCSARWMHRAEQIRSEIEELRKQIYTRQKKQQRAYIPGTLREWMQVDEAKSDPSIDQSAPSM